MCQACACRSAEVQHECLLRNPSQTRKTLWRPAGRPGLTPHRIQRAAALDYHTMCEILVARLPTGAVVIYTTKHHEQAPACPDLPFARRQSFTHFCCTAGLSLADGIPAHQRLAGAQTRGF